MATRSNPPEHLLLGSMYAELRRVAHNQLRHETPGLTLQPTALVNEAYLRLVQITHMTWQSRAHFFAMCSRLMRQILVDAARARRAAKRGGGAIRMSLDEDLLPAGGPLPDVVALDDALAALEALGTLASVESSNCVSLPVWYRGLWPTNNRAGSAMR